MSAVITARFGSPESIRLAQLGNAAYARALKLGHSYVAAHRYADLAKREAQDFEAPHQVSVRVVPPLDGPRGPGGGTPGAGVAA